MGGEIGETEKTALEDNIRGLMALKADGSEQAAKRTLELVDDSMGILFKGGSEPEPATEKGKLAQAAGKAKYEAGASIQIWGNDEKWTAWTKGDEADNGSELEAARKTIQDACDAGLRPQLNEVADKLAVDSAIRVKTEKVLLELAGGLNFLAMSSEKKVIFRARLADLNEEEAKANQRTAAQRIDFSEVPQVVQVNAIASKVSLAK